MNPYSVNPSLFFSVLDQNQALVTGLESSITLYISPIAFLNSLEWMKPMETVMVLYAFMNSLKASMNILSILSFIQFLDSSLYSDSIYI